MGASQPPRPASPLAWNCFLPPPGSSRAKSWNMRTHAGWGHESSAQKQCLPLPPLSTALRLGSLAQMGRLRPVPHSLARVTLLQGPSLLYVPVAGAGRTHWAAGQAGVKTAEAQNDRDTGLCRPAKAIHCPWLMLLALPGQGHLGSSHGPSVRGEQGASETQRGCGLLPLGPMSPAWGFPGASQARPSPIVGVFMKSHDFWVPFWKREGSGWGVPRERGGPGDPLQRLFPGAQPWPRPPGSQEATGQGAQGSCVLPRSGRRETGAGGRGLLWEQVVGCGDARCHPDRRLYGVGIAPGAGFPEEWSRDQVFTAKLPCRRLDKRPWEGW